MESNNMTPPIEFLKEKFNGYTKFIIKFSDGREIDFVELLTEYSSCSQSQPSPTVTEVRLDHIAMNIVNQLFDIAEVPVNKRQEINDVCDEFVKKLINSYTTPTVTDEEIDRRAEKFADDWEELGYSRENAYDYFKIGAKWMQSRLSQPVRETYNEMFSRAVKQLTVGMNDETVGSFRAQIEHDANMMINGVKMFSQSQPVTGYSDAVEFAEWIMTSNDNWCYDDNHPDESDTSGMWSRLSDRKYVTTQELYKKFKEEGSNEGK